MSRVQINFTEAQKKKFLSAVESNTPVVFNLKRSQLNAGRGQIVELTKTLHDRLIMNPAKFSLPLSKALLKRNKTAMKHGGSLATLAPMALEAFQVAGEHANSTGTASKLNNRLAFLKQMQGGSLPLNKDNGLQLGALAAQGDKEAIATIQTLKEKHDVAGPTDVIGSGMSGDGVKEFFEAVWWGFTNPVQALELGVRSIHEAIEGPKRKARQAKEAENFQRLNMINDMAKKANAQAGKGCDCEMKGNGITFY